jgi:hypothetical protein
VNKAMPFTEWWITEGRALELNLEALAQAAWDAAKESEMLANHPDVARARREGR